MPIQNNQIIALDIQNLLNGEDRYEIPIYQRNYAWEAKEIEQLIQDIIDYSIHHKNKNYYIGTLVVQIILGRRCSSTRIIQELLWLKKKMVENILLLT